MLDINIYSIDKPVFYEEKAVGKIPSLRLGSYMDLGKEDRHFFDKTYKEISDADKRVFNYALHVLGRDFWASSLVYQFYQTPNSFGRQLLLNFLRQIHEGNVSSRENLMTQQTHLLHFLHKKFTPEQMVAMLLQTHTAFQQQVKDKNY